MILCDTGPLVALIDRGDAAHATCVATSFMLTGPMVTTWPCLTEAMHFLHRAGGLPAQDELWGLLADGLLILRLPEDREWERLRTLMQDYSDSPMDLADASLVTAAEHLRVRRISTLDRHFHAYRMKGRKAFQVVP